MGNYEVVRGKAEDPGCFEKIYILQGKVEGRRSLADMINDVRANGTLRVASRPVKKDTLAYLIFSSGTSGLPVSVKSHSGEGSSCLDRVHQSMLERFDITH